jgi:uncharacterized membrane protein
MRIERTIKIDAPRSRVWDYITDPARYVEFMEGLTRWDVEGEKDRGLGARYRVLIRVGSADVGGLIEVVEWRPETDMAWSSVTGVDQRGRWRLRDAENDCTFVDFRFAYGVAGGGISGMLAERVASFPLSRRFQRSLENIKRALEQELLGDSIGP